MSRPFPFYTVKKDDPRFDDYNSEVALSNVDLHRAVAEFQLVSVPTSSSESGEPGMFAYDDNYFYWYARDEGVWKRVEGTTW